MASHTASCPQIEELERDLHDLRLELKKQAAEAKKEVQEALMR